MGEAANQGAGMQTTYEKRISWLDRPLASVITLNLETILFVLILVASIFTRFYMVGERVVSHDETSHVYFSWLFYQGRGYQHDPVTHGPLQFHLVALSYFLFGDSDFSAHIPAALFGVAAIAFIWFYRRYLGRAGALVAALLFTISPYMLFYSRYVRNESYVAFFGLVTLWAILRYLDSGAPRFLYILTAAIVLHFTSKETAYIYTAQALLFLGFYFLYRVTSRPWPTPQYRDVFLGALMTSLVFLSGAAFLLLYGQKPIEAGAQTPAPEMLPTFTVGIPSQLGYLLAGIALVALIAAGYYLVRGLTLRLIRTERSFDLLILIGTLALPLLAAFPLNAIGWKVPVNAARVSAMTMPDIIRMAIGTSVVIVIAILIGVWWNARLWVNNAAIFYSIFIVFYTTIFTNGAGFFTGLLGGLGYWMAQQEVNRGSQPWYYYALIQVPVYEYLPALGSLLALVIAFFRGSPKPDVTQPDTTGEPDQELSAEEVERPESAPFLPLFGFWAVTSLIAYTVAGEKMPWLTVHITLPMILLAGWSAGYLIDSIRWDSFRRLRGFVVLGLLFIFLTSFTAAIGSVIGANPPFQGKELVQLQATSNFLVSFMAAVASGLGLVYFLKDWAFGQIARVVTLAALLGLALLTARTALTSSFINYDNANELLVYAHAGPGVKIAMSQVEDISLRTTNGLGLMVAYDDQTTYPYWWYLRNYTNKREFGDNPTRDLRDYPVILAGQSNYAELEPVVGQAYYSFEYVRMWWPNQDYFFLTWDRVLNALKDRQMRSAIFQIWLNRDYTKFGQVTGKDTTSLTNWDPAQRFKLYVRKDIASMLWNYGSGPTEEVVADPYEGKQVQLQADQVIGSIGVEPGQFTNPRDIAVAPDGSLYVADSGNHRIQHLAADGSVLQVWGTYGVTDANGTAPAGTFWEPWGVAVGPDGSVYVSDTWNNRIQKFTADGQFVQTWG
ncbi:MAG: TIGR03663 family protein, partial [Chloroflexota bacterium]